MRLNRVVLVAAIGLALLGFRCADGFREDEMECENAMSYLAKCCPGFQSDQASCDYSDNSSACGTGVVVLPVLSVSESHCIEGESCDQLRSSEVCAHAQQLPYVPPSASAPQPVCP
jgi:hypothetical protein